MVVCHFLSQLYFYSFSHKLWELKRVECQDATVCFVLPARGLLSEAVEVEDFIFFKRMGGHWNLSPYARFRWIWPSHATTWQPSVFSVLFARVLEDLPSSLSCPSTRAEVRALQAEVAETWEFVACCVGQALPHSLAFWKTSSAGRSVGDWLHILRSFGGSFSEIPRGEKAIVFGPCHFCFFASFFLQISLKRVCRFDASAPSLAPLFLHLLRVACVHA